MASLLLAGSSFVGCLGALQPGSPEGAAADDGGACVTHVASAPQQLDHEFFAYDALATDGTWIYYSGGSDLYHSDDHVLRRPLAGGNAETFSYDSIILMKAHGTRLCWMAAGGAISCFENSVPKPLGAGSFRRQDFRYYDFDFDDTHVYWLDDVQVMRAPLDGSGPAEIVFDRANDPRSIAIYGDRVFWTEDVGFSLFGCTKTACASKQQLGTLGDVNHDIMGRIAADSDYVYVSLHHPGADGRRGGSVRRFHHDGGEDAPLVTCLEDSPVNVLVDGDDVFVLAHAGPYPDWQLPQAGDVLAFSRATGQRRLLATNQPYPTSLAATGTTLLWLNEAHGQGELMATPR